MAVVSIIFLIFVKSVYSLFGEYCAFSSCLLQEKDLYACSIAYDEFVQLLDL